MKVIAAMNMTLDGFCAIRKGLMLPGKYFLPNLTQNILFFGILTLRALIAILKKFLKQHVQKAYTYSTVPVTDSCCH
jgi:hypothetical protein